MCTREFRARKRAQRDAANRRASAEANLPPRSALGAGRFRVGDEVTINGAPYRVTAVDTASGTVRGVPTDWNGPEHTIRERNARERAAMDEATIDREDPEAALAAQYAADVDRVTREREHAAFEARQRAHHEENARREAQRQSQSRSQAEAAQTPAEAQREADMTIAGVARTDFKLGRTSVGRIDASGGINGIGDAPIGKGFLYGGSNCYCEAETMEARRVWSERVSAPKHGRLTDKPR
ncbi:MAG: hypothetical protein IJQ00_00580 [Kiritimatiellae bacterium]|nr:hypothetical protein [Kiritimatiellia bacterium]